MGRKALLNQYSNDVFDVVHARILRFFPDLVDQLGGDPTLLMRQVGISPKKKPSDTKSGATYRQMVELIEHAATQATMPRLRYAPGDTSERQWNVRSVRDWS